jgi:type I restriction enzyme, S subunit
MWQSAGRWGRWDMASDFSLLNRQAWPSRTLREANVILIDCDHRTPPAQEQGYPYVTIPQLKNGRIELSSSRRISPEHYVEWTRKAKPSPHDVVLSRRCNPGETAFVPPDVEFALGQNLVLLRADGSEVYPPFLRWLVRGPEWWDQIKTFLNVGAVFESLRCAEIPKFTLTIPPLDEQKIIADFLGSLDAKLETLQRQNALMEELARTIFKSWFVDFDPVRAKAEGREPDGLDAYTAALFPNEFEESSCGSIPDGWNMGRLDDLLVLQRGFDLPSVERIPGPFPIIAASGPSGTHSEYRVKGPGVVTGRSGVLGNVYWVDDDFWPLNTSLWVKEYKRATPAYALQYLRTLDLSSFNAGSAVPTLNRNHIHGLPTVVPPAIIVQAFDELATPLFESIRMNQKQAATLTDLRDTLLPRLISGKLRVPEAEAMLAGGCREV